MNYDKAISDLEKRVAQLEQLALKTDRESHRHTSEIDDTSNKAEFTSSRLDDTDGHVEVNTANIDYIAMMSDIDIPTED